MKTRNFILNFLFCCLIFKTASSFAQESYTNVHFEDCAAAVNLHCGQNVIHAFPMNGNPNFPANVENAFAIYYFINVTSTTQASFVFSNPNGNPYAMKIFKSANATVQEYCNGGGGVLFFYYDYQGTGTTPVYNSPVISFQPGLYVFIVKQRMVSNVDKTFFELNVTMNCGTVTCPTIVASDYSILPCREIDRQVKSCDGKCKSVLGSIVLNNPDNTSFTASINYGDGTGIQSLGTSTTSVLNFIHNYSAGTYIVTASITNPANCATTYTFPVNVICQPPPCSDCIGSFAPIPGNEYIISAWVKENTAPAETETYVNASIDVSLWSAMSTQPNPQQVGTTLVAKGKGIIIDGWQKIEESITIPPSGIGALRIKLNSGGKDVNFDDIRVFPSKGSMKSYVYDPNTMRLMAELDERNYATLYEYDEEGKLIRVKKETERGIMTIKESRNSAPVK